MLFNPLPNDVILDYTKLKAFEDDKINAAQKIISVFGQLENIEEKKRKCWFQAFSPFPRMFLKAFSLTFIKS